MNIYNYDENGVFTGISEARIDPLESMGKADPVYLIPRNATIDPVPTEDGKIGVFSDGEWSLVEDHRGEEAYDGFDKVIVTSVGSLVDLGFTASEPTPPPPSAKQTRDEALQALEYDFGDGRVMQVRPKDEQNVRNAIEIMTSQSIPSIQWVMKDNTKQAVTAAELGEALLAGQLAAMAIWNNYTPE